MFMVKLLQSMKILIKPPVMVRVDNVRAIFNARKITATSYTRNMDMKYK